MFAARILDTCCGLIGSCGVCGGPFSYGCGAPICTASPTFILEGLPVARLTDLTHVGPIISTSNTILLADGLPIASLLDTTPCGFISQVTAQTLYIVN
jgi:uncharacterized Zn-binding protein involved in type VI secretion